MTFQCIFKPQIEDGTARYGLEDGVPLEKDPGILGHLGGSMLNFSCRYCRGILGPWVPQLRRSNLSLDIVQQDREESLKPKAGTVVGVFINQCPNSKKRWNVLFA